MRAEKRGARVSDASEIKLRGPYGVSGARPDEGKERRIEETGRIRIPFPFAFDRTKTENVVKLRNLALNSFADSIAAPSIPVPFVVASRRTDARGTEYRLS